ncbi:hypothetical protein PV05_06661 [Exophiala xenobiotica]|uniref:Heterokaryon incompatibility domain-containing protein n=1 Tax=Exophiala xenobiotica TaxID=348802 RepID=A0A0D2F2X8_9EURO|nr:uncharacterized protein PV05_06661 [Exophiala xenobiotica]KIW54294.1 hypothetical protein PV05_06661 [Exophiala xenobiotica]
MDQVYGFASLTITASSSEDKWEGLFCPRQEQKSIPSSTLPHSGHHVLLTTGWTSSHIVDRSPLARRAWTLQEDIPSRLAVYVSRDQLYWNDLEHFPADDGLTYPQLGPAGFLSAEGSPVQTWSWLLNRWRRVVDNYAPRNLFAASHIFIGIGRPSRSISETHECYLPGGTVAGGTASRSLVNDKGDRHSQEGPTTLSRMALVMGFPHWSTPV